MGDFRCQRGRTSNLERGVAPVVSPDQPTAGLLCTWEENIQSPVPLVGQRPLVPSGTTPEVQTKETCHLPLPELAPKASRDPLNRSELRLALLDHPAARLPPLNSQASATRRDMAIHLPRATELQ